MITSKLPSSTGIKLILWFRKYRVQPRIIETIPIIFPSADSTMYLVSNVDGAISLRRLKGSGYKASIGYVLDKSMWTAQEKKNQKIDLLARSFLIQGLPNDTYSLIDGNDSAKELCDALKRHMIDSKYGEQDMKAAVLYEDVNEAMSYKKKVVMVTSDPLTLVAKKTKVTKGREKVVVQSESEGSDDEDISDLKKITSLLAKAFNQKKYYAKPTNNNLRTSSALTSANKKPKKLLQACLFTFLLLTLWILVPSFGDVNEAMSYKKKAVMVTSDPLTLVAKKTKVTKRKEKVVVQSESEGSDDEDINDLKKITSLLAKAFNQKKYYAKPTNNNLRTSLASTSANKKPKYVKSDDKKDDGKK
nr:hypothetical protein [Tanacetum cinerariifolium]